MLVSKSKSRRNRERRRLQLEALEPREVLSNVYYGTNGDLLYRVQNNGDRIIDFGAAGYMGLGELAVPSAAALTHLPSLSLTTGQSVQAAINQVATWPMQPDGFRGVIYLGTSHSANFNVNASGIVLIGRQMNPYVGGTTKLTFRGNDQTAIEIGGQDGGPVTRGPRTRIASSRVPTGSRSFLVSDPSLFAVGDRVEIDLMPNTTWVRDIGMDRELWKPSDLDKKMRRVVTSINGNEINIDEPTVITVWDRHGGATINTVAGGGPIQNVGIMGVNIEGIPIRGATTLPGVAVHLGFAKDVFLRNIHTTGFQRSALYVAGGVENLTAYNVQYRGAGPTSGSHRYGFQIGGQRNFMYELRSFSARHAFVPNHGSTGGNVFRLAESVGDLYESGGHRHWAGATLWDQVHIGNSTLTARRETLPGVHHGWRAVNSVAWNSRGRRGAQDVIFQNPPYAYNIKESITAGIPSLYNAQRADRSGGVEFREYVIGDYDNGAQVGEVDRHVPDPKWAARFPDRVVLDTPLAGRTVAMTLRLNLQPGERVVGGQLSMGRPGGTGSATVNLNDTHVVQSPGTVTTIDVSDKLDAIQDGNFNVAVTAANGKVDFAMLKLKIVNDAGPSARANVKHTDLTPDVQDDLSSYSVSTAPVGDDSDSDLAPALGYLATVDMRAKQIPFGGEFTQAERGNRQLEIVPSIQQGIAPIQDAVSAEVPIFQATEPVATTPLEQVFVELAL